VLLGISLVLNGTAYAMGGTHMVEAHAHAMAGGHCEGHGAMHAHAGADVGHGHDHAQHGHPAPDCCKTSSCTCASPTAPAAVTLVLHETAIDRFDASTLACGHRPPALASLIRPPIA
jgi:hypothetical protein